MTCTPWQTCCAVTLHSCSHKGSLETWLQDNIEAHKPVQYQSTLERANGVCTYAMLLAYAR